MLKTLAQPLELLCCLVGVKRGGGWPVSLQCPAEQVGVEAGGFLPWASSSCGRFLDCLCSFLEPPLSDAETAELLDTCLGSVLALPPQAEGRREKDGPVAEARQKEVWPQEHPWGCARVSSQAPGFHSAVFLLPKGQSSPEVPELQKGGQSC